MGLVEDPGRVGVPLSLGPFGVRVGPGDDGVAIAIGAAGEDLISGVAFGPERGGDPLAFAPDQVEDRGANLDRVVEPPEPDVDHLDPQLIPRRRGDGGDDLGRHRVERPELRVGGGDGGESAGPEGLADRGGDPVVDPCLGDVERPRRSDEPVGVDDPPGDVARHLQVPLIPRDEFARRRVGDPEAAVDDPGPAPGPLEVETGLVGAVAVGRDGAAELGDDDELGLIDEDRRPRRDRDEEGGETDDGDRPERA